MNAELREAFEKIQGLLEKLGKKEPSKKEQLFEQDVESLRKRFFEILEIAYSNYPNSTNFKWEISVSYTIKPIWCQLVSQDNDKGNLLVNGYRPEKLLGYPVKYVAYNGPDIKIYPD